VRIITLTTLIHTAAMLGAAKARGRTRPRLLAVGALPNGLPCHCTKHTGARSTSILDAQRHKSFPTVTAHAPESLKWLAVPHHAHVPFVCAIHHTRALVCAFMLTCPHHAHVPFVCAIHLVQMSKSLGNVIDPLGVIQDYGTDALRFTMATGVS